VVAGVASKVGHKAGQTVEGDWSEPTMQLVDPATCKSLAELAQVKHRMPQVLVNVKGVDAEVQAAVVNAEARLGASGRVLLAPRAPSPWPG